LHRSSVGPEKAIYKLGDTRLAKQTTWNAGDVGDMQKQAST